MPYQLFSDEFHPVAGVVYGKVDIPSLASRHALYMAQHPFASRSAFAYTVVVLVCIALMVVAGLALGRILAEHNRKAHGIIGWSAVMVGAWSLVLLTAMPYFVPCPTFVGPGITCSVASQAAAHWALGLLPLALLLTVLPMIVAFSTRRLLDRPAASPAVREGTLV
jgi:hypothetical protein